MEEKTITITPETSENTINIISQENEKQVLTEKEMTIIGGSGVSYQAGENIKIENNTISVITTNEVEQDNSKPITSAGVYTTVGNINELLKTI